MKPTRQLKLLFVSLNYAPELTATGRYTGEMAEWFAANGHKVDAIAGLPHYPEWKVRPDYIDSGFKAEMLNGVRVLRTPHFVPPIHKISGFSRIIMECSFTLLSTYWWLRILLRREKYDAVIAICPPMQNASFPWLYQLFRNTPYIFHIQDFQVDAAFRLGILKTGPAARVLYFLEGFFLRRARRISTISKAMKNRAIERKVDSELVWLLPNWGDLSKITPASHNNRFRDQLQLDASQTLIMYAGAVGRKQGLDLLLEVASLLHGNPKYQFVIVGTGADSSRLSSLAAEKNLGNLRFLPLQPECMLSEMLAAADVHLVVQRREAADLVMPSKLTNILSAGRPSIATAEEGSALSDVLEESESGLCTPPEDAKALAEAISTLCDNPERREAMGINARNYAVNNLNRDAILKRFEEQLLGMT